MTLRHITVLYLWAVILITTCYDIWVFYKDPSATISRVIVETAHDNPILPVLIGIVIGHLFWYMAKS